MGESIGRIITWFVAVIVMFIVPITLQAVKQDDMKQAVIDDAVVEFVDNARAAGEISPTSYLNFMSRVNAAHKICDVRVFYEASEVTPVPESEAGALSGYGYKRSLQTFGVDDITGYMFYKTDAYGNIIRNASGFPQDLDEPRDFPLKEGGYLSVEVVNKTPTLGTQMARLFIPQYGGTTLLSSYGGYVGNNKQ